VAKYIKYIAISITAFMLVMAIFKISPNVSLKKINHEELKALRLISGKKLYICKLTTYTGPEWVVIGDKNGLFGEEEPEEQVIIEGDFLPFLFRDKQDDLYSETNFAIIAEAEGKKSFSKDDPSQYRVLKAVKWYVYSDK